MYLFKKYLLATAARFAPPDETGAEGEHDVQDDANEEGEGQDEALEADDEAGLSAADEGEDEEGEDEGQVDDAPRAKKPSRAQTRIQTLRDETRATKERADKLERELAEFRAEQRQREQRSQQESPDQRAARRALMAPEEVMREDLRESEARTQNMLHQLRMEQQELTDRTTYDGILREAPHLRKFEAEVEKIRLEQKANNVFVPREVILDLAIGRAARKAATAGGAKAKQAGAKKVAQQQVKPASTKGDTTTVRGRQADSLEKRLENLPI